MQVELQRTAEWYSQREGKLTASMAGQAAGLGPGSRQQAFRRFFHHETFTGNSATDWGTEKESVALEAFKQLDFIHDSSIELTGFVRHPSIEWFGGSPDFLLANGKGMGEIKCPYSQELYDGIPPYYMAQMQALMEITGREYCEFVVWTPAKMQVSRVLRSAEYWDWLYLRLTDFWMYIVAEVEPGRDKKPTPPPTDHLIFTF